MIDTFMTLHCRLITMVDIRLRHLSAKPETKFEKQNKKKSFLIFDRKSKFSILK